MEREEKIERLDNATQAITAARVAALAINLAIKEHGRTEEVAEKEEYWELLWDNIEYLNQHLDTIQLETSILFEELYVNNPPYQLQKGVNHERQ